MGKKALLNNITRYTRSSRLKKGLQLLPISQKTPFYLQTKNTVKYFHENIIGFVRGLLQPTA